MNKEELRLYAELSYRIGQDRQLPISVVQVATPPQFERTSLNAVEAIKELRLRNIQEQFSTRFERETISSPIEDPLEAFVPGATRAERLRYFIDTVYAELWPVDGRGEYTENMWLGQINQDAQESGRVLTGAPTVVPPEA